MSCHTSRDNDCMGQNTIRILVIGKSGVGKTLLIQRLCREVFGPYPSKDDEELLKTKIKPTIGFAVDALMRDAWVSASASQQPYDPGVIHHSNLGNAHTTGVSARTAQARRMYATLSPESAMSEIRQTSTGYIAASGATRFTGQRSQRALRPQIVEFYEMGGTRSFGDAHRLPLRLIPYDGIMYVYNRCDPASTEYLNVWYQRLNELFDSVSPASGGRGRGEALGAGGVKSPAKAGSSTMNKSGGSSSTSNGHNTHTGNTTVHDVHANTVNIHSMFPHYNEEGCSTTTPVRYRRKPKIILVGTQLRPSLPRELCGWYGVRTGKGLLGGGCGGCCVMQSLHPHANARGRDSAGGGAVFVGSDKARTYVPDEIAMITGVARAVAWEEQNEHDGGESAQQRCMSYSAYHSNYSSESTGSYSFRNSMTESGGEGGTHGGSSSDGRSRAHFLLGEGGLCESALPTMSSTRCDEGRAWRYLWFLPRLAMKVVHLFLFFVYVVMHPSALLSQMHHEEQSCPRERRGTMRVAERVAACVAAVEWVFVYGINLVLFGPGQDTMPLHQPTAASTLLTIRQDDDCIAQLHKCCLYDRLALETSLDELLSSFDLLLSEKIAAQR